LQSDVRRRPVLDAVMRVVDQGPDLEVMVGEAVHEHVDPGRHASEHERVRPFRGEIDLHADSVYPRVSPMAMAFDRHLWANGRLPASKKQRALSRYAMNTP
jgi:hypothetical protein